MDFTVVIPARMASTRLPRKPLADLAGQPMVVRVAQQAARSGASQVLVATDHAEIAEAVRLAGFEAVLTHEDHPSGTDRLAEVATQQQWPQDKIVVNLQGDEPLMAPELIRATAQALSNRNASIATAAHPIHTATEIFNPNVVKVVLDNDGCALYFSRAPIPWARDAWAAYSATVSPTTTTLPAVPAGLTVFRHIGLYAYRVAFLHAYADLPPTPLEQWEALEQLRALAAGHRIQVVKTSQAPLPGVDTQEDLERVRALLARNP